MPLFKSPLLILDTETTGFPGQHWSRVVEIAAVLLDTDGTEIGRFESLILPDILDERAAGALAVNHITPEMLADAPPTEEVAARFVGWWKTCGSPWATAFNVGFDRPMCERMTLDLRWASCIMKRSMEVMGPLGVLRPGKFGKQWLWPKLSFAAEHFGVSVVGDAHRALTDARTAAGIAIAIRRHALLLEQARAEVAGGAA